MESEKKISRVLIIADASSQALALILDSFRTLRKDHLQSVRITFVSYLSETLKKNLGPNILGALARQETEALVKAKELFDRISTPYDLKVIVVPPWNTVLDEIRDGNHDLLMLQGEFLDFWEQYAARGCPYREMINRSERLVMTIE